MKKFSEKSRKVLRKIFLFLGVSAVALVFQACYGMPYYGYDEWEEGNKGPGQENEPENVPESEEKQVIE